MKTELSMKKATMTAERNFAGTPRVTHTHISVDEKKRGEKQIFEKKRQNCRKKNEEKEKR